MKNYLFFVKIFLFSILTFVIGCEFEAVKVRELASEPGIQLSLTEDGDLNDLGILKAFPGAEGFGSTTPGGRGGRVVFVTNLNDSGGGSLRYALEQESGPRIVVFRVGGTIELSREIQMRGEDDSRVTIAGQTAPGDGISLKNYGLILRGGLDGSDIHDVVIRYLRIRVNPQVSIGDGITLYGDTARVRDVVIDHCSISWAKDENIGMNGVENVTVMRSILSEAYHDNVVISGGTPIPIGSKALLAARGGLNNISIHHNYFAHNAIRTPAVDGQFGSTPVVADIRNNVIYNYYKDAVSFGTRTHVNFINNKIVPGPSTNDAVQGLAIGDSSNPNPNTNDIKLYLRRNAGALCPMGCGSTLEEEWFIGVRSLYVSNPFYADPSYHQVFERFLVPSVTTVSFALLDDYVMDDVGANFPSSDAVDSRVIGDYVTGSGDISIGYDFNQDGQAAQMLFPFISNGSSYPDLDNAGMDDSWEVANGLVVGIDDSAQVHMSGYTYIELFFESLTQ